MPVVQPQENTAGAPTTGLGQNVTFAFDAPGSPATQTGGGDTSLNNTSVQGGKTVGLGATQAQYVKPPPENPTLDLLARFGDQYVNQKLKEAKGRAYVSGMQKAMQGEAISDIADEQPWYTRIFGQSDAVEGARQYLGNTRAQSVAIGMVDDMPNLRKLDGSDVTDYFNKAVQGALTGDPLADAAIMNHFTTVLPTVMKQQTKENFAYKQELAANGQAASFKAGAASLQQAGSQTQGDIWSESDVQNQANNFMTSIMPAAGQDFKSYQTGMMGNIIEAAQQGQFHVLNALVAPTTDPQTGKTHSFIDMFDPVQQRQIQQAITRGAEAARTKGTNDYAERIIQLDNLATHPDDGMTDHDVMNLATGINDDYQKSTGSPVGVLSQAQVISYAHRAQDAIIGERVAEAKRADAASRSAVTQEQKAAAAQGKLDNIDRAAATGDLGTLSSVPGYSNDAIDSRVADSVNTMLTQGNAAGAMKTLTANFLKGTYVVKPIQDQLVGHVLTSIAGDAGPTSGFMQAYGEWKAMNDVSPDMAAAYYQKSGVGARMAQFDKLYTAGVPTNLQPGQPAMPPSMAFSVFGKGWNPEPVDAADATRAMDAVTSKYDSLRARIGHGWFGGDAIRPDAAARLATELSHTMKDYVPSAGINGAASRALAIELTTGKTSIIGEHVIMNQPPRQQTLESYFSKTGPNGQTAVPTGENLGDTFNDAVMGALMTHTVPQPGGTVNTVTGVMDSKPTNLIISRLPDTNGVPNLTIWASDKDGKVYIAPLKASDVWAQAKQYREAQKYQSSIQHQTDVQNNVLGPVPKQQPGIGFNGLPTQ